MARARHRLVISLVGTLSVAVSPLLAQGGGAGGAGAGGPVGPAGSETFATVTAARQVKAPPPPLVINVLAVPFPIGGALDDQVALLVEVGGKELLVDNPGNELAGQIVAKATDGSGKVVDELTQPFVLDASDETLHHGGLKLYAVLRVPPGDYKVAVSALNGATHAHGNREVTLHAPDYGRKEAALSPPLFSEKPDRWLVFRQSDSPHDALPFPFVDGKGGGFLPAAAPTLPPAGGEMVVFAYGALTDAQQIQGRLVDRDGKPLPGHVKVLDSATGRFAIERRLLLEVDGPLPTGTHRLEVSVADSAGAHVTSVPLTVAADAEAPTAVAIKSEPESQEPPEEAPSLPAGWTSAQLEGRYHDVLARAAGGDLDGAAVALAELELAATPQRSEGQLKALRNAERDGLEAMGSARGMLPVIDLYFRADRELKRRNEAWMAAQNRIWSGELMGRWVKANGDDATSHHMAAQVLASEGSIPQALVYEPSNELALLRTAINQEKGGSLAEAATTLATLVKAHPESAHGRLRLGVVLRRQGQAEEAKRQLAQVLADPHAPRWVAALACQELAAAAHDKGDETGAEATLKVGVAKLGLQSLYVQLAYYQDEHQRPDEAIATLNSMPINAGQGERSGRHLYNAPPEGELAAARGELETRVAGEWPQLRAALHVAALPQQGSSR